MNNLRRGKKRDGEAVFHPRGTGQCGIRAHVKILTSRTVEGLDNEVRRDGV